MEWNQQTLPTLSDALLHTLSPYPEQRGHAEKYLSEVSDQPNFGLNLLRLVAEPSVDDQIRQSAAVTFKNHLRNRWVISSTNSNGLMKPISDSEKDQIKGLIVPLMLSTTSRIQSQLSEALTVIGKHDFPKAWGGLLPELVNSLRQGNDYASINGILGVANSLFKKFRYEYKSNELYRDLKTCLDGFAAPLLEMFMKTSVLIDSTLNYGGNAVSLKPLFESQRLCCRIFYSLNSQELPEFFEDHMKEWMGEFLKYLTTQYPALENSSDGMAVVDDLRAAVCDNLNLNLEKNEEEFKGFLEGFATAVWELLIRISGSPNRDRLTITAISFLTTISKGVHHTLFGGDFLKIICESVVIPNVHLSEEDLELFEMNYVEFIRRDMEGSDLDTRRRISCELFKGIATNYKCQVSEIVRLQVDNMLASFKANPAANWKEKDCAIYLVVSLATKKAGGSSVSTDLLDVEKFLIDAIVPELQNGNGFPILKAGALKFLTLFRNQIPKHFVITLMPQVIQFLTAESNVVHSYAATCIEKLLLVKEEGGRPRYTYTDIALFLRTLMINLFKALKHPESEENPYVMKCIMRVIGVADLSAEVALDCITGLAEILREVCKNPRNPIFNHYLFEAVAGLVRSCEKNIFLISDFEMTLFPIIQFILGMEITDFSPYAFQLLAQLVEFSRPPMKYSYIQVFDLLLVPEVWMKRASVPALVRLLQAFLKKAPNELNQRDTLTCVLEVSNRLVEIPNTEELGFYVLNTAIENLPYEVILPAVSSIWAGLFTMLHNHRSSSVRFAKCLVIFMSLFLIKYGLSNFVDSINSVQDALIGVVLKSIWIPNLKLITGTTESKLASVASTKLICEFLDPSDTTLWGPMLNSIVTLLSRPEQERVGEETEIPDIEESGGHTATFTHLQNAGKKDEDPLKEIKDPKEFLVQSLARLANSSPGKYLSIIQQSLGSADQIAFFELLTA